MKMNNVKPVKMIDYLNSAPICQFMKIKTVL